MPRLSNRWCLAALALATGCQFGAYYLRDVREPMLGLEARADARTRQRCLLVLMPGMLNLPDAYFQHGFVADALRASRRCDVLALDAHNGYYASGTLRRRFGEDVLVVAEQRGYEDIWLVGSSMGGMGALLLAQAYPDRVDGLFLLAPYFGGGGLLRSIAEAGGLAAWRPPARAERTEAAALWVWLQGYATHPERMPPLYLGVGDDDGMRFGVDLLAAHLPPSRIGRAPGAHAWATWRVLWRRLLVRPPWDPRGGTPRLDR